MSMFTKRQPRRQGFKRKTAVLIGSALLSVFFSFSAFASWEGTRHIRGDGIDLYFMNDKVFGHVNENPLWAIYTCASDIKGEMDVKGTYHRLDLRYDQAGEFKITGSFGPQQIAVTTIEKTERGLIYGVLIGKKAYSFSTRYERLEREHMVNGIIEGKIDGGKELKLTVDGPLCPFATAGIILIVAGSSLAF